MATERAVFVWDASIPLRPRPQRLGFRALASDNDPEFARMIEGSLAGTLDRHDRDSLAGTSKPLANFYLRPDPGHFEYRLEWWQVAYDPTGEAIGFIQPVLFVGSNRGGLAEGTIHYIGVIPDQRGRGYIRDLLWQATSVLLAIGVWRIYCDTDTENRPMVGAFEAIGYRSEGRRPPPPREDP